MKALTIERLNILTSSLGDMGDLSCGLLQITDHHSPLSLFKYVDSHTCAYRGYASDGMVCCELLNILHPLLVFILSQLNNMTQRAALFIHMRNVYKKKILCVFVKGEVLACAYY